MLSVRDLSLRRGAFVHLLEGVSFDLGPGEALVLRGANGIGKTTLLRTVAGLAPPADGTIEVDPDALAFAGHLDGLKPTLTVEENLRFWARLHGRDAAPDRLAKALATCGVEGLGAFAVGDLSAGQRRRAGLARLPLLDRPIWVLDEPTVTLDRASVLRFEGMLRAHLQGGGAALLSSHLPIEGARALDLETFRPDPAPLEEGWG